MLSPDKVWQQLMVQSRSSHRLQRILPKCQQPVHTYTAHLHTPNVCCHVNCLEYCHQTRHKVQSLSGEFTVANSLRMDKQPLWRWALQWERLYPEEAQEQARSSQQQSQNSPEASPEAAPKQPRARAPPLLSCIPLCDTVCPAFQPWHSQE